MKLIKNNKIVLLNDLWAWNQESDSNSEAISYFYAPKGFEIEILDIIEADYTSNTLKFKIKDKIAYTMIENLSESMGVEYENSFS